jgi:hypothetical protein
VAAAHAVIRAVVRQQHQLTRQYIALQFQLYRDQFVYDYFFRQLLQPMMQLATEHLTAAAMHQMLIVGTFFDARQTMESLQLMQELAARAHKDYQPSVSMCEFGTMARTLASTQRTGEFTAFAINQRGESRGRGEAFTSGSAGNAPDAKARADLFRTRYCDTAQENGNLAGSICKDGGNADVATRDKDVNYERVLDNPISLSVDFTNPSDETANQDRADIFALQNNLYGSTVFERIPPLLLNTQENQEIYLDLRSVLAKRAVAENSFAAIVGMKAKGSADAAGKASAADTAKYMKAVFRQLGVNNDADVDLLLGDRPSYYAQMEILTKKLYQRPEFYTNLYDKPANVERKEAALRAIGLMQDMDKFKSELRSEMLMSVILESQLDALQGSVEDRIGSAGVEEGVKRQ